MVNNFPTISWLVYIHMQNAYRHGKHGKPWYIYIYENHDKPHNPIQIFFIVLINTTPIHRTRHPSQICPNYTNPNPCQPKSKKVQYICAIEVFTLMLTVMHLPSLFSLSQPTSLSPATSRTQCHASPFFAHPTSSLYSAPTFSLSKPLIFFFSKPSRNNSPLVIRQENFARPFYNFTMVCIFSHFIFPPKTTSIYYKSTT